MIPTKIAVAVWSIYGCEQRQYAACYWMVPNTPAAVMRGGDRLVISPAGCPK